MEPSLDPHSSAFRVTLKESEGFFWGGTRKTHPLHPASTTSVCRDVIYCDLLEHPLQSLINHPGPC